MWDARWELSEHWGAVVGVWRDLGGWPGLNWHEKEVLGTAQQVKAVPTGRRGAGIGRIGATETPGWSTAGHHFGGTGMVEVPSLGHRMGSRHSLCLHAVPEGSV